MTCLTINFPEFYLQILIINQKYIQDNLVQMQPNPDMSMYSASHWAQIKQLMSQSVELSLEVKEQMDAFNKKCKQLNRQAKLDLNSIYFKNFISQCKQYPSIDTWLQKIIEFLIEVQANQSAQKRSKEELIEKICQTLNLVQKCQLRIGQSLEWTENVKVYQRYLQSKKQLKQYLISLQNKFSDISQKLTTILQHGIKWSNKNGVSINQSGQIEKPLAKGAMNEQSKTANSKNKSIQSKSGTTQRQIGSWKQPKHQISQSVIQNSSSDTATKIIDRIDANLIKFSNYIAEFSKFRIKSNRIDYLNDKRYLLYHNKEYAKTREQFKLLLIVHSLLSRERKNSLQRLQTYIFRMKRNLIQTDTIINSISSKLISIKYDKETIQIADQHLSNLNNGLKMLKSDLQQLDQDVKTQIKLIQSKKSTKKKETKLQQTKEKVSQQEITYIKEQTTVSQISSAEKQKQNHNFDQDQERFRLDKKSQGLGQSYKDNCANNQQSGPSTGQEKKVQSQQQMKQNQQQPEFIGNDKPAQLVNKTAHHHQVNQPEPDPINQLNTYNSAGFKQQGKYQNNHQLQNSLDKKQKLLQPNLENNPTFSTQLEQSQFKQLMRKKQQVERKGNNIMVDLQPRLKPSKQNNHHQANLLVEQSTKSHQQTIGQKQKAENQNLDDTVVFVVGQFNEETYKQKIAVLEQRLTRQYPQKISQLTKKYEKQIQDLNQEMADKTQVQLNNKMQFQSANKTMHLQKQELTRQISLLNGQRQRFQSKINNLTSKIQTLQQQSKQNSQNKKLDQTRQIYQIRANKVIQGINSTIINKIKNFDINIIQQGVSQLISKNQSDRTNKLVSVQKKLLEQCQEKLRQSKAQLINQISAYEVSIGTQYSENQIGKLASLFQNRLTSEFNLIAQRLKTKLIDLQAHDISYGQITLQLHGLKNQMQTSNSQLIKLKSETQKWSSELGILKKETQLAHLQLKAYKQDAQKVNSQLASKQAKITNLKQQQTTLQQYRKTLEQNLQQCKLDMEQLARVRQERAAQRQIYEQHIEKAKDDKIHRLQYKIQQLNRTIAQQKRTNSQLKQTEANLTSRLEQLQAQMQQNNKKQKKQILESLLKSQSQLAQDINKSNKTNSYKMSMIQTSKDQTLQTLDAQYQSLKQIYQQQLKTIKSNQENYKRQIKTLKQSFKILNDTITKQRDQLKSQLRRIEPSQLAMREYLKKLHDSFHKYLLYYKSISSPFQAEEKRRTSLFDQIQSAQVLQTQHVIEIMNSWRKVATIFQTSVQVLKQLNEEQRQIQKSIQDQLIQSQSMLQKNNQQIKGLQSILSELNRCKTYTQMEQITTSKLPSIPNKLIQNHLPGNINSSRNILTRTYQQLHLLITKSIKATIENAVKQTKKELTQTLAQSYNQKTKQIQEKANSLLKDKSTKLNLLEQQKRKIEDQFRIKNKQIQGKMALLQTQNSNYTLKVSELQKQLTQYVKSLKKQAQISENLASQKEDLQQQISQFKKILQLNEKEIKQQRQTKQKQALQMTKSLTQLRNQDNNKNVKIAYLDKQIIKLKADVKNLEKVEQDYNNVNDELSQLKTKHKSLLDDYRNVTKTLLGLQKQKQSLERNFTSTQTNKRTELQTKNQEINKLKDQNLANKQTINKLQNDKSSLQSHLAQSLQNIKELKEKIQQSAFRLKTQQQKSQTSLTLTTQLKSQISGLDGVIRRISREVANKLKVRPEQINPENIIQRLQQFNPTVGMKLITSTIMLGLDQNRSEVCDQIQKFMKSRIRRTDIIFKCQSNSKTMSHIMFSKQISNISFAMIYKTSKGKIFGSFSEGIGKRTLIFSIPNRGLEERFQMSSNEQKTKFYMRDNQQSSISPISIYNRQFLVYGSDQMKIKIGDVTSVTGNSNVVGKVYYEGVDWTQIFKDNNQVNVALTQVEIHRVEFS